MTFVTHQYVMVWTSVNQPEWGGQDLLLPAQCFPRCNSLSDEWVHFVGLLFNSTLFRKMLSSVS